MYKRILVPTDGSVRSRKAAKAAIALAKKTGAKITAYYATELRLPYIGAESALMDPTVIEMVEHTARKQGEKYVAEIAAAASPRSYSAA
jgi:nucleotide-binding universal stress UspA family protein